MNAGGARAITTDVFDTILLREPVSERARMMRTSETLAARIEISGAGAIPPEIIYRTRRRVQAAAFSALNLNPVSEVTFEALTRRVLMLLGLPETLAETVWNIEYEAERGWVRPNAPLAERFRRERANGLRVIAISDTVWPAEGVRRLIEDVAGPDVVDAVHTSADHGLTKRGGALFEAVLKQEGVLGLTITHFGDDAKADGKMAAAAGLSPCIRPRSKLFVMQRRIDGLLFEAQRLASGAGEGRPRTPLSPDADAQREDIGRNILGPMIADMSVRLWCVLDAMEPAGDAAALFCTRGGLLMRKAFETVVQRLELPQQAPARDFMVSRVAAVRPALLAGSPGAIAELTREFRGAALREMADAVGGERFDLPDAWRTPVNAASLSAFMADGDSAAFRKAIADQTALFLRHVEACLEGRSTPVLVDTGLYGSTLRLLREGLPEFNWKSVVLARSNYKRQDTAHFAHMAGLLVEDDVYNPFNAATAMLRNWHFIEALFEPQLESVVRYEEAGGEVRSNLEFDGWREAMESRLGALQRGMFAYLDGLDRDALFRDVLQGRRRWSRLRQLLIFPDRDQAALLMSHERSRDFGRREFVPGYAPVRNAPIARRFAGARNALWREGALALEFPNTRGVLQAATEGVYASRWLWRRLRRR